MENKPIEGIAFKSHSYGTYHSNDNALDLEINASSAKFCQDKDSNTSGIWSIFSKSKTSGQIKFNTSATQNGTKLYKRRFWMLFIYCVSSAINAMLWIQFSSISSIVQCYYQVGAFEVNWTSTTFLIVYVVMVLPISWFMDRFGLKPTVIAGAVINSLSTIIQCTATSRNGFPILLASQTIAGIGNAIVLPVPPRLAAVWFGPNEVCRATAVGVFGNQLGIALGFLIPSSVVTNDCSTPDVIKERLAILAYCLTAINILNLALIIWTYQKKPPLPPSEVSKAEIKVEYSTSLINLIKNSNFRWLVLTYGLVIGVALTISALLNQMLEPYYPHSETIIGWIGLSQIFAGFGGALLAGYILDMTHRFKLISMIICVFGLVSIIIFAGMLYVPNIWAQLPVLILIGFFVNGFFPVGFEFASELTYPEPEGTVAGLMNCSSMIFALLFTMVGSGLEQNYGSLAACIFFCVGIAVACVTCGIIKPELRRTEKNMENMSGHNKKDENGAVKSITRNN